MASTQQLRDQRRQKYAEARRLIDDLPKDATTPGQLKEAEDKFDAAMKEVDALDSLITKTDAADAREKELTARRENVALRTGMHVADVEASDEAQKAAFRAWMQGGVNGAGPEHRPIIIRQIERGMGVFGAAGTSAGSAGGFLVPEGFYNQILTAQKAWGGVRENATVIQTATGNDIPVPTINDTGNSGELLAQNTTASEQDVTFGSATLGAYTFSSKLVRVSWQMLQDSAFDMDMFLSGILGTRIGRITNSYFTTGTGTGEPYGIVTATTAGVTGTSLELTTVNYNNLVDTEHAVDPAYRIGAKWMFNDGVLKVIKRLTDGDSRPLWMPGLVAGAPNTINGYPYVVNQNMSIISSASAGTKVILFGQLSNYIVRDVKAITMVRLEERFADALQTGFIAFARHDGRMPNQTHGPVKYWATGTTA
jgi:HK97 family phage major capsid protein